MRPSQLLAHTPEPGPHCQQIVHDVPLGGAGAGGHLAGEAQQQQYR